LVAGLKEKASTPPEKGYTYLKSSAAHAGGPFELVARLLLRLFAAATEARDRDSLVRLVRLARLGPAKKAGCEKAGARASRPPSAFGPLALAGWDAQAGVGVVHVARLGASSPKSAIAPKIVPLGSV